MNPAAGDGHAGDGKGGLDGPLVFQVGHVKVDLSAVRLAAMSRLDGRGS